MGMEYTFGSNIESVEWLEGVEAGEEDTIEGKTVPSNWESDWMPDPCQAVAGVWCIRLSPRELRDLERLEELQDQQ